MPYKFNNKTPSQLINLIERGYSSAGWYVLLMKNKSSVLNILEQENPLWFENNKQKINDLQNKSDLAIFLALKQFDSSISWSGQSILDDGSDSRVKEIDDYLNSVWSVTSPDNESSGTNTPQVRSLNFSDIVDKMSGWVGGKNETKVNDTTTVTSSTRSNYIPVVAGGIGLITIALIGMTALKN